LRTVLGSPNLKIKPTRRKGRADQGICCVRFPQTELPKDVMTHAEDGIAPVKNFLAAPRRTENPAR
jgi:hypothetical protein